MSYQCKCSCKNAQQDGGALFLGQMFGCIIVLLSLGALVVLGSLDAALNFARVFALVFSCFFGAVIAAVCFIVDACEVEILQDLRAEARDEPEEELPEPPSSVSNKI